MPASYSSSNTHTDRQLSSNLSQAILFELNEGNPELPEDGLNDFRGAELSIVVPTFNEVENIPLLIERIREQLSGIKWELVVVDDDSPDGTADTLRSIAREDRRVRCIQRIGRRGLSSACVEGVLSTSSPYVAVMDADLQHDERCLREMLAMLKEGGLDAVVGTRYSGEGGIGDWSGWRARISRVSGGLGRKVLSVTLTDPMSGFFVVRRTFFDMTFRRLSPNGFKILLDLFVSSPSPVKYGEVPYTFSSRIKGESKLDSRVALDFLKLLIEKKVGKYVPVSFVFFGFVGALGLIVHLAILGLGMEILKANFVAAQLTATFSAMIFNYLLNNSVTFYDRRRRGWKLLTGLCSFVAICSLGTVANVGVANVVFADKPIWWFAGSAGALVGSVWNYAMSSVFTWRNRG